MCCAHSAAQRGARTARRRGAREPGPLCQAGGTRVGCCTTRTSQSCHPHRRTSSLRPAGRHMTAHVQREPWPSQRERSRGGSCADARAAAPTALGIPARNANPARADSRGGKGSARARRRALKNHIAARDHLSEAFWPAAPTHTRAPASSGSLAPALDEPRLSERIYCTIHTVQYPTLKNFSFVPEIPK